LRRANPEELDDDQVLTQYGTASDGFRCQPRWSKEDALSLIRGRLSGEEASRVVRRGRLLGEGRDLARYTSAGTLRRAGFEVLHTPTRLNPDHVSVRFKDDWDEEVCDAFDDAFSSDGDDPRG
jgi:hypothetical protein